jgi:hypothetical protein
MAISRVSPDGGKGEFKHKTGALNEGIISFKALFLLLGVNRRNLGKQEL